MFGDVFYYFNVVRGILLVIGLNVVVEFWRWGVEFLVEVFVILVLFNGEKEIM